MKTVQTVLGQVATNELGSVLMHEHLLASSMGIAMSYPQFYPENYMDVVLKDLADIKAEGIKTVVEATPVGLGRDIRGLKELSEKSGVNIIATTGWWGMEPPYMGPSTAEQWAKCFIDDITKGCDGTDIKAGILKGAMNGMPSPFETKVHHALGMANKETGTKIILHTYTPKETPRDQLAALQAEGVDMNDVCVGHIPETCDLDFVKWIYDQGVWLGIDRLPCVCGPGEYAVPTETRVKFIKQMLDAGMGDRMLFSHDFMAIDTMHWNQPKEIFDFMMDQCPDRFLFIKKHIFPQLAEMGVDPEYLWNLTIDNPAKFFEGK